MGTLNVIALISGGKDSLFSILHCLANGHRVIALANLHPQLPGDGGKGGESKLLPDDLDSFMYQTVGHTVIPLYEEALGIPLYRQPIRGTAIDVGKSYDSLGDGLHSPSAEAYDETESLVPLLQRILQDHPVVNAVSTGAILSDYQRTRVESVAVRLGLVPLSFLWQYPHLGNGQETSLLDDMGVVGQDARIIKVASGGLDTSFLWENVAGQRTKKRLLKAMGRFGGLGGGATLGEGGEYETLTVDGPAPLWKKRIDIRDEDRTTVQGGGGSAYLKITGATLVTKSGLTEGALDLETLEGLRIPDLLAADFDNAVRSIDIEEAFDAGFSFIEPEEIHGGNLVAKETWAMRRGETALFISNMVATKSKQGSVESEITDVVGRLRALLESENRTPDDIVYSTIILRSMASFPDVNRIYSTLFARPNPPARATIACGEYLGGGIQLLLSAVVDLRPRRFRKGLHVQSRSYWAPANIGPYSQAIASPLHTGGDIKGGSVSDSLVYIAGQIPLEPATMELPKLTAHKMDDLYSFRFQAALALQHLWRIAECMDTKWWVGGIAFIARCPDIQRRARIAQRMWEGKNSACRDARSVGNGGKEEEEVTLDIWDRKYGGANDILSNGKTKIPLPSIELIDTAGPLAPMSPFFAVEVDELPRGSHIEWSGVGLSGPGRIHISSEKEEGSTASDDIPMNCCCLLSDKCSGLTYGTIRDGLSSERFWSALEWMLLSGGEPSFQRAGMVSFTRILQITVYTAKDPSWELEWNPSPSLPDCPVVTVMPCRSVWGDDGTRMGAGVVIRREVAKGERS
jgi:diphthine-ammonia ligase